jgi:hypothetical protein
MSKKKDELKEYFRHDYHARNHLKFKNLRMAMGLEGLGIYWCVVEMLYEEGGSIQRAHYDSIAFDLHIDKNKLKNVIEDFGLFAVDEKVFSSPKVIARLKDRRIKSKKASDAIKKRWEKVRKKDTSVLPPNNDRTSIIEEDRIEDKKIIIPFGDDFRVAWEEWKKHRIEKRDKLTPSTELKQLKKLSKYTEQVAIAMIDQSVTNGWTGLFEVKGSYSKQENRYKVQ